MSHEHDATLPAPAAKHPVTRTHHGIDFVDDYEWLRDKESPDTLAYLEAENAHTEQATAHLEGLRARLFDEVRSRVQETDLSVPVRMGDWWYFTRTAEGSKYGVRMKATAPCLHIIKTNITTEVSPVVGTESQSVDLAQNLAEQFGKDGDTIWETNLFGKSLKDMVTEQMESKVSNVPENLRGKVQRSLQKISDEGKDYFICIIL